jgi:hypothetical protein
VPEKQREPGERIPLAENLVSPILTFQLELHRATINGSTRAALHDWRADLENPTTAIGEIGHRQLEKMVPRMNTQLKAQAVADPIVDERDPSSLSGENDRESVMRAIGEIILKTVPQNNTREKEAFEKGSGENQACV